MVRQRGWRSAVWVPLLLEHEVIGAIGVTRVEPGTFADHHVDMLKTFADQAVIAISNVNLFRQVQDRTRDLEESLQQQTATSEVLQVISRSVFDLKTVLQTLLESAAGLCDASICILFQSRGDLLHVGASYGGTLRIRQISVDPSASSLIVRRSPDAPRSNVVRSTFPTSPRIPNTSFPVHKARRLAVDHRRAASARRRGARRSRSGQTRRWAVHSATNQTDRNFCRPGRDRDRECPPVRRGAAAHQRACRFARRASHRAGPPGANRKTGLAQPAHLPASRTRSRTR